MTSYYSVLQYIPDPVRDERVNFGVLAFGGGVVRRVFLSNWTRVRNFAQSDVEFLKRLVHETGDWDEAAIRRLAEQWTGSIQITAPSASLLAPDELVLDASKRFLIDSVLTTLGYRPRQTAVNTARTWVKEKLKERVGGRWRALLRDEKYHLPGTHKAYEFDIAVGNGRPFFALQALSFEVPNTKPLEKEIEATAWRVKEVHDASPGLPIGVFTFPPFGDENDRSRLFEEAHQIFSDLGVAVIGEPQLPAWAGEMVAALPEGV
jgi:hypothetical protein